MTASGFNYVKGTNEGLFYTSKDNAAEFGGSFFEYADGWETLSPIVMEGGVEFTNIIPADIEEIKVDGTFKVIIYILAFATILMSISFMLWTLINSKTKIVRRAQPGFLYIMCLGCIMSSSVPVIITLDSKESCQGAWLVYACGFSLSMGALAAKTLRVYRMINAAKSLKLLKLTFVDALPPLVFLFVIDCSIALAMISSGDVDYLVEDTIVDNFGRVLERESRCKAKGPTVYAFFLTNIGILSVLAIICYKSRKISTDYSESKYISMSVASALQIISAGFLLIAIADSNPSVEFLMVSLMTLVTDGSTLGLIFVPKIYLLFVNATNKTTSDSTANSQVSHAGSIAATE